VRAASHGRAAPVERLAGMDEERTSRIWARMPVRTRAVLGVVHEGEDQAHAVYRIRWLVSGEATDDGVRIVSLRRTPDGWRLLMDGELFEQGLTLYISSGSDDPDEEDSFGISEWAAGR
jgi:hypothetical protein